MNPLKKKRRKKWQTCISWQQMDKVNSNISDEDIHNTFQELYEDFEKPGLKNIFLKKKVQ